MKKIILFASLFPTLCWAAPQWFEGTSQVRVDNPNSRLITIEGESARAIYEMLQEDGVHGTKCGPNTYLQGESITCAFNKDQANYACYQWIGPAGHAMAMIPNCPFPSMGVSN
ncbi:MAG: hypothetical protein ACXVB4_13535 [Pseudobdellovibrionaceae bacterium]